MRPFEMQDLGSVSPSTQTMLQDLNLKMGFIPNLARVTATSDPAFEAFAMLNQKFSESSFTPAEKETIEITTSIENRCGYCTAAHSRFAYEVGMTKAQVQALRAGKEVDDPRLEALRQFTRQLVRSKGHVSQSDLVYFFDAGFSPAQALEVILGITVKTFTNFVSNSVNIPLDPAFKDHAWSEAELATE